MAQGSAALQLYREASSLAPRDPRYAVAVSRLALAAGDVAGAREAAAAAVRAVPRDARALVALAAALHAHGDTREARQAVDGALAVEPDLPEARALLKRLRWSLFG